MVLVLREDFGTETCRGLDIIEIRQLALGSDFNYGVEYKCSDGLNTWYFFETSVEEIDGHYILIGTKEDRGGKEPKSRGGRKKNIGVAHDTSEAHGMLHKICLEEADRVGRLYGEGKQIKIRDYIQKKWGTKTYPNNS